MEISQYDYDKGLVKSLPNYSKEDVEKSKEYVKNFLIEQILQVNDNSYYFMLLNNETHYYTVFHYTNRILMIEILVDELIEIVQSLGKIKSIVKEQDSLNFWILNKQDEILLYKLFNYNWGVIEL